MSQADYETLGLGPRATRAEILAAHRRLAKELHPDSNPGPDATQRMAAVNHARDALLARFKLGEAPELNRTAVPPPTAATRGPIPVPGGLRITDSGNGSVAIAWDWAGPSPATFNIYRGWGVTVTKLTTVEGGITSFTDRAVPPGRYRYRVSAVVDGRESAATEPVSVTLAGPTNSAPRSSFVLRQSRRS